VVRKERDAALQEVHDVGTNLRSRRTVWAYHRYIQGIYADAPVDITMRHLADLVLALRRELGHPGSKVTALDLMGFRINDIYQNGVGLPWTRFSLQDLYSAAAWTPPWGDRFKYGKPLK
jgi:hypothetical protein